MSKIDEFKLFASKRPELAKSVRDNKTTWQKLYEVYDIYGSDSDVWKEYTKPDKESNLNIKNILNSLSSIDTESFQNNIDSIQRAIGFVEELTRKDEKKERKIKKAESYKTFDKFYSD